jgi:hypothetical protein
MSAGRKTETLFATGTLAGRTRTSAVESFDSALKALEDAATKEDREVLYDTLEVSIERDHMEEGTLTQKYATIIEDAYFSVKASAVKR